jgi:Myb/SANT-like DNA-binding domain
MKSAEKKPKEAPVKWIETNRKILIASLLNFSNGPISNLNNSKAGWNNVVADFHEKTGLSYNKEKLTHQGSTMKKNYIIFDKFVNNSGFGVDARGAVTGPTEAINAYLASKPKAVQFADEPLHFYSELSILFGSKYLTLLKNFNTRPDFNLSKLEFR